MLFYGVYWPLARSFVAGSVHTARVTLRNPGAQSCSYNGKLYLGKYEGNEVASASKSFILDGGEQKDIDFSVTMPDVLDTYHVYLDIYVAGECVAAYQATEDVTITASAGAWECPVCNALFVTWDELRTHIQSNHPDGFQVGASVGTVTSTSAQLGAGSTRACRYVFWLKNPDGSGTKIAERTTYSTNEFWVNVTGLTQSTHYTFLALGIDSNNRVVIGSGSFTTEAAPQPPKPGDFAYINFIGSTHPIPGESEKYIEVSCDIENTTPSTQTRTVALWISNVNTYGWTQITWPSFAGWASWAIPSGIWNAGTITLTLAPGEVFNFHYGGYGAAPTNYLQLRDSGGGASKTITVYR